MSTNSSISAGGLSNLLSTHLSSRPLTPTANNVASTLLTILYVKMVMEVGALIRTRNAPELSRKFIHLCFVRCSFLAVVRCDGLGVEVECYGAGCDERSIVLQGGDLKDPEDYDVRLMSRTSSPSELLYGPLQMTCVMTYVGWTKFHSPQKAIVIMASFVGDWMAAMIGLHYGRHGYRLPLGGDKSIEGNIACVVGTMGGIVFYSFMLSVEVMKWELLVAYGVVSAVAEATAICNWDNLVLLGVMEVSMKHLPGMTG